MTPAEAATKYGVPVRKIYAMIQSGELVAEKIHRKMVDGATCDMLPDSFPPAESVRPGLTRWDVKGRSRDLKKEKRNEPPSATRRV
jgi:excisionase family DNA binding protein